MECEEEDPDAIREAYWNSMPDEYDADDGLGDESGDEGGDDSGDEDSDEDGDEDMADVEENSEEGLWEDVEE